MKNSMRILLVSDMHYTTEETYKELKQIYPSSVTSFAAGKAFGMTQREKVEKVLEGILEENEKAPLDLVLNLGDLSLDDYDYRNLPENYCLKFREECMARTPCPTYVLAGNHDSYPEEEWKEMFGYGRQYALERNGILFLMLDNFRHYPAKDASGSGYTKTDVAFIRRELEKHPGMPVFLCAHFFAELSESEEFRTIVRETPEIVCLLRGHTHHNAVIRMDESYGGKYLIDIGGYAYNGMKIDGKYTFSRFQSAWAWGYEIMEIEGDSVRFHHRKPPIHYSAENGEFDFPETISGELELPLHRA